MYAYEEIKTFQSSPKPHSPILITSNSKFLRMYFSGESFLKLPVIFLQLYKSKIFIYNI